MNLRGLKRDLTLLNKISLSKVDINILLENT